MAWLKDGFSLRSASFSSFGNKSALLGWWGPKSLIMNCITIPMNLTRAMRLTDDPQKLSETYREFGLPMPGEEADWRQAIYFLQASMIVADGKIADEEVRTAIEAGKQLVDGYDEDAFVEVLRARASRSNATYGARMLARVMEDDVKWRIMAILYRIAEADGKVAMSEKSRLKEIACELFGQEVSMSTIKQACAQG